MKALMTLTVFLVCTSANANIYEKLVGLAQANGNQIELIGEVVEVAKELNPQNYLESSTIGDECALSIDYDAETKELAASMEYSRSYSSPKYLVLKTDSSERLEKVESSFDTNYFDLPEAVRKRITRFQIKNGDLEVSFEGNSRSLPFFKLEYEFEYKCGNFR